MAPVLVRAEAPYRRVCTYDYDATLSAYLYNIWMATVTFLPLVERHMTGFCTFIYAYDATRSPAISWEPYSFTCQCHNYTTTSLRAYDDRPNLNNYAVNSNVSCNSTDYDACSYTSSVSDMKVTLPDDPLRAKCNYDETGLYYYGYRLYSPELGRWLSRDPLGEYAFLKKHGSTKSREERAALEIRSRDPLYVFVFNSSVNHLDGLGLVEITLNIDSSCDGDKGSKIQDAFNKAINAINDADVPVNLVPVVDCLKSSKKKKTMDVECGGVVCCLGGMQGWNLFDGTIHVCNKTFGGPSPKLYNLGTVVLVEIAKNQCGLTIAREYEFADWLNKLLLGTP